MSVAMSGIELVAYSEREPKNPVKSDYVPTEAETCVLQECYHECFWYRSLPLSVLAIAVTRALITKKVIMPSSGFDSLRKLASAGLLGYITGKLSYVRKCGKKFENLKNSALQQAIQQGNIGYIHHRLLLHELEYFRPHSAVSQESESELEADVAFQPVEDSQLYPNSSTSDYPHHSPSSSYDSTSFNSVQSESAVFSPRDDYAPQAPQDEDEDVPKKKTVLYEELRNKNRENYEVLLAQKTESLLKPQAKVVAPKQPVHRNKYGDVVDD
ncbi:OCIA domain-containing protein 1 [Salminus brasiliensis]|uniref:OCIA domain-containing protein 1 n=1 Tax=Salminus brasiliensis TaxID=930266 RepID=UPI003B82F8B0